MAFQSLYQAGALGPGSHIWLIPDFGESPWTNRIDWYLNYQVTRAERHNPLEQPKPLRQIVESSELMLESSPLEPHKPLMIACSNKLPAEAVVKIGQTGGPQQWVDQAHQIWQQMGRKSLRVFLPQGLDETEFKSKWPEAPTTYELTMVPAR